MKHYRLFTLMCALFLSVAFAGCNKQISPTPTPNTQQTTEPTNTMETLIPPPSGGGKLVACNSDADCVPNPSECHTHSCVTKIAADGMEKVEMCTMLFDYQAAYSAEDCTCDLGKCVNKNLGRTGDAPPAN